MRDALNFETEPLAEGGYVALDRRTGATVSGPDVYDLYDRLRVMYIKNRYGVETLPPPKENL